MSLALPGAAERTSYFEHVSGGKETDTTAEMSDAKAICDLVALQSQTRSRAWLPFCSRRDGTSFTGVDGGEPDTSNGYIIRWATNVEGDEVLDGCDIRDWGTRALRCGNSMLQSVMNEPPGRETPGALVRRETQPVLKRLYEREYTQ